MSVLRRIRYFWLVAWLGLAAVTVPRSIAAQVTYGNASTGTGNVLSFSFSHTVGTGNQRLLVVAVTIRNGLNLANGVSYGGTALTSLRSVRNSDNTVRVELWYLKNPPSGTANVTVNLLGLTNQAAGAVSFSGVDQTTPFGAVAADSSTDDGTSNPATTVASGDRKSRARRRGPRRRRRNSDGGSGTDPTLDCHDRRRRQQCPGSREAPSRARRRWR